MSEPGFHMDETNLMVQWGIAGDTDLKPATVAAIKAVVEAILPEETILIQLSHYQEILLEMQRLQQKLEEHGK